MEHILSIQAIKKSYTTIQALKGVSFDVPRGSVFGILGPNGSGKTTLLGILLDVLKANEGSYQWAGYNNAVDARISAKIKGRGEDDIENVLKKVNLFERRSFPFSSFSLGMKQRLAIAAALLGNPSILVFDEPTNGLDPVGITEIRELILQLNQSGITIIMASHLLDEVEKVCTHVAILKQGNLISSGHVSDVLSDEDWIELNAQDKPKLLAILNTHPHIKKVRNEQYIHACFSTKIQAESLNEYCFQQGIILNHIQLKKRSLESKFMELTQ
jgi:ABC-type multidrug transport system ATPase subunit